MCYKNITLQLKVFLTQRESLTLVIQSTLIVEVKYHCPVVLQNRFQLTSFHHKLLLIMCSMQYLRNVVTHVSPAW